MTAILSRPQCVNSLSIEKNDIFTDMINKYILTDDNIKSFFIKKMHQDGEDGGVLVDDMSTLDHVLTRYQHAKSYYLKQYWYEFMTPYVITRP